MLINYAHIINESIVDGPGIRTVVFFQGCPHACKGCHNPELWPILERISIDTQELVDLILSKVTPLHRGITLSGGEPLIQCLPLIEIVRAIKQEKPNLDIWVYTGYKYEEIKDFSLFKLLFKAIDVLVDRPYIEELRDIGLPYRGSSNQNIIYLKEEN